MTFFNQKSLEWNAKTGPMTNVVVNKTLVNSVDKKRLKVTQKMD
jgi:hypothetical protein